MLLPELDELRSFPARGPEGTHNVDINRRAAAIECYLDLEIQGHPPAEVIWTNYKKDIDSYQGSLEFKESYVKAFLELRRDTLLAGRYNISKLKHILDALVLHCCSISTADLNTPSQK
jgi:hypothetical protein